MLAPLTAQGLLQNTAVIAGRVSVLPKDTTAGRMLNYSNLFYYNTLLQDSDFTQIVCREKQISRNRYCCRHSTNHLYLFLISIQFQVGGDLQLKTLVMERGGVPHLQRCSPCLFLTSFNNMRTICSGSA